MQARTFASSFADVLNTTVCDNVKVGAVVERASAYVGTNLDRADLSTSAVRLRTTARTKVWLDISCSLYTNEEGYLTVASSYCGIYLGDEQELLLHYDYERDKTAYTEAHIQVAGDHPMLEQLLREVGRPRDKMKKLHLPVGGRRLRPSLEDLLESLIAERILSPKVGWQKILGDSRLTYRKNQIAAVVRSNQATAIATLKRLGYEVVRREDTAAAKPANKGVVRQRRSDE
ncbi:hypothetical protein [Asanoa ishikariensis]|uniref:hypothetical protein n=1 Tax=Asanoa ishikariensis TaxID=137265 RepID=UPI00115FFBCE|nr:hypothetical protein [Asanoa ishikariensis]